MREKAREIAIEVVKRLNMNSNGDFSYLQENIAQLNSRIQQLESQVSPNSKSQIPNQINPSLEKFNIAEAVVEELTEFLHQEKVCTFEPGNKPCDHCSMCGSRGF
jgi:paraquat-inducible protein B